MIPSTTLSRLHLALLLAALALPGSGPLQAETVTKAFRSETLADGVVLFRPVDESSARTNSLLVLRDDGPLVVDSQPTPSAARELLQQIRELTPAPVRYLVLSHAHAESAGGASAFPDSTVIVASAWCYHDLDDPGFDFDGEMSRLSSETTPWQAPPRRLPHLVLSSEVTLADPTNPVRIIALGRSGHAPGDLLVEVKDAQIVYAGALLFPDRNPYVQDGNIGGWISALNRLAKMSDFRFVPLRGGVIDAFAVRPMRESLAWVRGQVMSGFIDRKPPEEIVETIMTAPDLTKYFDEDARPSFVHELVQRAVSEALEDRRRHGYE